jgi:hypothetical protein
VQAHSRQASLQTSWQPATFSYGKGNKHYGIENIGMKNQVLYEIKNRPIGIADLLLTVVKAAFLLILL